jgi:prephenate dehydrogenase
MKKSLTHVRIVGAGLIGTSIALALRSSGISVTLNDSDSRALSLARDLMGEQKAQVDAFEDLCIIATPPEAISMVISQELTRNASLKVMEISSIKTKPLLDVSKSGFSLSYV